MTFSKYRKIKHKEKILKEAKGQNALFIEKELHPTSPQKPYKQEENTVKYLKCSEKKTTNLGLYFNLKEN